MDAKRIIIGSDHAGYHLKETIKQYLAEMGHEITDVGTHCMDDTDYPDFGIMVSKRVSSGEFTRGILICGSGVGMTIVANKFPSVRAVLCLDEDTARMSRLHNDTNVLVLAGRRTDIERAKTITGTWLKTAFEGGRHQRRLDKIRDMERKLCGR
ncbi:MAG: ribose 5-phosphate isomerase B [Syntrophaceae bacterium CG2_30_49_12]|nr:MAG: ribose 5-phosphate isomerase B [Syntrophaceae bacterium CG2_30_49_12]PIP05106.1 MAG: ribose 5-phosphate isomerase B [Syntrophobacterales bacterium CG23_combo_of_CG06-09_8_20_14_all_48_27]PJA49558.1 MAG: ribose 5-phosphate isomerase B [Syntrophobacterales bacterium CG_4_9_14_3_um_filter_49_8]PJC75702.1 MAG: ribose 5-phosphate isomerase B [Syntrophobacterales bacterium CG_4_8_14_3_um_filter_49_14]